MQKKQSSLHSTTIYTTLGNTLSPCVCLRKGTDHNLWGPAQPKHVWTDSSESHRASTEENAQGVVLGEKEHCLDDSVSVELHS
jgi:hypothetical protein